MNAQENMARPLADERRDDHAKVTRKTSEGDRDRSPIFRVTFIPRSFHAANTTSARCATRDEESCWESASLVSFPPSSAQRREDADAKAWRKAEYWTSRSVWAVVTITLLVDVVATFGHSAGLPWRM